MNKGGVYVTARDEWREEQVGGVGRMEENEIRPADSCRSGRVYIHAVDGYGTFSRDL